MTGRNRNIVHLTEPKIALRGARSQGRNERIKAVKFGSAQFPPRLMMDWAALYLVGVGRSRLTALPALGACFVFIEPSSSTSQTKKQAP